MSETAQVIDLDREAIKQGLREGSILLVDVREPHEFAIARIPGAKLIPLGQVVERAAELDTADDIVLHCRSGKRSADALQQLRQVGFKRLANLKGGILSWSDEVDPTVPKY